VRYVQRWKNEEQEGERRSKKDAEDEGASGVVRCAHKFDPALVKLISSLLVSLMILI
jgi:hypothetical protein